MFRISVIALLSYIQHFTSRDCLQCLFLFTGDKGLDLVENHIEKALSKESNKMETTDSSEKDQPMEEDTKVSLKRPASEDIVESESKKPHLTTNMNGTSNVSGTDSPAPESVSSSNGDDAPATVCFLILGEKNNFLYNN